MNFSGITVDEDFLHPEKRSERKRQLKEKINVALDKANGELASESDSDDLALIYQAQIMLGSQLGSSDRSMQTDEHHHHMSQSVIGEQIQIADGPQILENGDKDSYHLAEDDNDRDEEGSSCLE